MSGQEGQRVTRLTVVCWQNWQWVFVCPSLCHVMAQVWCWFMQIRLSAAVWTMVAGKQYSLYNSMHEE